MRLTNQTQGEGLGLHLGGLMQVRIGDDELCGFLDDVVFTTTGDVVALVLDLPHTSNLTGIPWHAIRSYRCTPPTEGNTP